MRAEDRGTVFFSYGLIQLAIGEQAGDPRELEQAVAAHREALKECTRVRPARTIEIVPH
jgi:hypothetical protein